jgi:hypothetical protein
VRLVTVPIGNVVRSRRSFRSNNYLSFTLKRLATICSPNLISSAKTRWLETPAKPTKNTRGLASGKGSNPLRQLSKFQWLGLMCFATT